MKKLEELNVSEIIDMYHHTIKMADLYSTQASNYAFSPNEEDKKLHQKYSDMRTDCYNAANLLDAEFNKMVRFILKK